MIISQAIYRKTAVPVIEKGMNAAVLRNKAIADNLANITTKDYRKIEIKFEESLKNALNGTVLKGMRTQVSHLPAGRKELNQVFAEGYRSKTPVKPGEINNVDIDMEAAKLAENQLGFNYAAKFMQTQLEDLTDVIKKK